MGRPKKTNKETIPEIEKSIPETVTEATPEYQNVSNELNIFLSTPQYRQLEDINDSVNDSVSVLKDGELLNAFMMHSGSTDKEKIMFLFHMFRQQERQRRGF